MVAKIDLGRKYREQICPGLARQAEQANANKSSSGIIDYAALIDCRKKAETRLEGINKVLYRNRLGFTFYTSNGSKLVQKADGNEEEMSKRRCPWD